MHILYLRANLDQVLGVLGGEAQQGPASILLHLCVLRVASHCRDHGFNPPLRACVCLRLLAATFCCCARVRATYSHMYSCLFLYLCADLGRVLGMICGDIPQGPTRILLQLRVLRVASHCRDHGFNPPLRACVCLRLLVATFCFCARVRATYTHICIHVYSLPARQS